MPEIVTRHFGVVSCNEDAVLLFPAGLPAFEASRRFVLLDRPATSPIVFLQNLEDGELCFMLLPVQAVIPDYRLALSPEDLKLLQLDDSTTLRIGTDVACMAILSVTDRCQPTVNLLAPVVVNLANRLAVQAIRSDSTYSHQHPLTPDGVRCS